jgi:16S rRNA (uracil1498-N3)-methyltransferase
MNRAFVEGLRAGRLVLEQRHLARVLRVRPGDEVVLFDGQGREAGARVVVVDGELLTMDVGEPRVGVGAAPIALIVALLKGDRMDWVVQKATELGVARISPIAAAHSVVRLAGDRATARTERWAKIAREAARQCGRADAPLVDPVAEPAAAFHQAVGTRLILHETERAVSLREALARAYDSPSRISPDMIETHPPLQGRGELSVALAIGPEGGFTEEEVVAAQAAGFVACGFGPRILRAETAALAALAAVAFAVGELG